MVVQCCVCKKIRVDGEWRETDADRPNPAEASHGYCPNCADDAFREVREYHRHNFRGFAPRVANS